MRQQQIDEFWDRISRTLLTQMRAGQTPWFMAAVWCTQDPITKEPRDVAAEGCISMLVMGMPTDQRELSVAASHITTVVVAGRGIGSLACQVARVLPDSDEATEARRTGRMTADYIMSHPDAQWSVVGVVETSGHFQTITQPVVRDDGLLILGEKTASELVRKDDPHTPYSLPFGESIPRRWSDVDSGLIRVADVSASVLHARGILRRHGQQTLTAHRIG